MIVLGIETAAPQTGVALAVDGAVVASFHLRHDRRHAEELIPAIDLLCRSTDLQPGSLDLIAVDNGPGLFTGLRVGLATAKTIAYAHNIPMVGVSSLEALAFGARFTSRRIVSTLDALRGEIYAASYAALDGDNLTNLSAPQLTTPEALVGQILEWKEACLIVGDGLSNRPDIVETLADVRQAGDLHKYPSADAVVLLAAQWANNGPSNCAGVELIYLREPYIQPGKHASRPAS
jgi:tRNA threonylcarbamoyladenosine biosynthesis protein TsaB